MGHPDRCDARKEQIPRVSEAESRGMTMQKSFKFRVSSESRSLAAPRDDKPEKGMDRRGAKKKQIPRSLLRPRDDNIEVPKKYPPRVWRWAEMRVILYDVTTYD
jgi:hypothetical protein